MIISRTPFRISFFGGGTDYPDWYRKHGGVVLSTSIDKYCYIICRYLPPFFNYKYRIRYTIREETNTIEEIQHPSVRECLLYLNFTKGVEIQHNADLPAMSGLGSSSAFSVGLLHALYALKGKIVSKRKLALEAIHVEQERIKENVGSQDQVITAFGGFNKIVFNAQQIATVYPITIDKDKLYNLQKHLMLIFTGFSRNASMVAAEQIKNIPQKEKELKAMMEITDEAVNTLDSDNDDIAIFGKLLDDSWRIKQSLAPNITTPSINEIYESALNAGAIGGKLLGAGNGGFMLIFAKPENQPKIREKLKRLLFVPFSFENLGSQIIYYTYDAYKDIT